MPLDLFSLNPEQRDAVATTEGPLLVLAGAGTGKTRVITYRMAYLMTQGVEPRNILAMTFTNKAAREMRERLTALTSGLPGINTVAVRRQLVAGTFHSFCVRVLRQEIEALGYRENFTIFDESDQSGLLKKLITRVGGKKESLEPKLAASLISLAKNKGSDIRSVTRDDMVWEVSRRYNEELKLQNAVDFDDLLVLTVRLLRDYPESRARLRERHRTILVDEYQDTNSLQFDIVRLLASDRHDVCAVGDDDQSIYGWRGAEAGNILEFDRHFPGAKIVKLEQNYRSTPTILGVANEIIRHNKRRRTKVLRSSLREGEKVRLVTAVNEHEEAEWVVGDLNLISLNEGLKWEDFVILYRMNAQSRVFEQELRRRHIPYRMVGGMSFFDRREIKNVLAYLQTCLNPSDDVSLLRIINDPPRGLGKTTVDALKESSTKANRPVWDSLREEIACENKGRASEKLTAFAELIDRYTERFSKPVGKAEALRDLLEEIGFYKDLDKSCKEPQEYLNRRENVGELIRALDDFEKSEPGGGKLTDFIDSMVLDRQKDDDDEMKGSGVTLMTLHSAKGLEFPHVYLVGLEEGLLPHERSKLEGNVDEERRLLYVGVTRAMRRFTASYCCTRKKYGQEEFRNPSPFIDEIPEASIVRVSAADSSKPVESGGGSSAMSALEALMNKL